MNRVRSMPLYSIHVRRKWGKIFKEKISPNSLHKLITALNVFTEKSTLQSRQRISGSWTLRVLCIGVKCRRASAATPYWSRVLLVLVNQWFLSGHHNAWSDQSMAMSTYTQNEMDYWKYRRSYRFITRRFHFTKMDTVDCLMLLKRR